MIVLSTGVTNNALVLMDPINETRGAATSRWRARRGSSVRTASRCANGGHGEEAAILAAYLADQGLLRVVVTGEGTEGDAEYRQFFREQAALYGVEILDDALLPEQPERRRARRGAHPVP